MKITGKGHKASNLLLFTFILVFGVALQAMSADYQHFGLVTVSPDFELSDVNGRSPVRLSTSGLAWSISTGMVIPTS